MQLIELHKYYRHYLRLLQVYIGTCTRFFKISDVTMMLDVNNVVKITYLFATVCVRLLASLLNLCEELNLRGFVLSLNCV